MLIELNIITSTSSTFVIISANDTTGISWRRELLNIITTQNFVYNYNSGHRRTFEGHTGTDATTTGTDAEARWTAQAATRPDAAADRRHPEGRRDYGTTAPDAPISSFRLHCRAMEGLAATPRDVCQRQLCTWQEEGYSIPDQPDQWYVQTNYQLYFAARCPTTTNDMKFSDITDVMSSHYDTTQFTTMETTIGATSTSLRSCLGYRPRCRHQ